MIDVEKCKATLPGVEHEPAALTETAHLAKLTSLTINIYR